MSLLNRETVTLSLSPDELSNVIGYLNRGYSGLSNIWYDVRVTRNPFSGNLTFKLSVEKAKINSLSMEATIDVIKQGVLE